MSERKLRLENIARVLRDPSLLVGEVNHQATKFNAWLHVCMLESDGIHIMQESWDNLIILDGCRYDIFNEQSSLPGHLQKVKSQASQSLEFMNKNFSGGAYHDTVYVSANPYTTQLDFSIFHKVIELYTTHWDSKFETVLPETVMNATIEAHRNYPNKKLLVHFMQPHFPFIGKFGQGLDHVGLNHDNLELGDEDKNRFPVWSNLRYGFTDISIDEVWKAYRENLDRVLPYVRTLINDLDGQTVVTSDHGNLLGERIWPIPVRGYGHPAGLRVPELVEVPWLTIQNDRRNTTTGDPETTNNLADVDEQLRALGYKS